MTTRIAHRVCTLCEATCGLEIEIDDGRATRIRGDSQDPLSGGYTCPKAQGLLDLQNDPDRLRKPVRRTSTGWEEIEWEEAFELAARGLRETAERGGPDAIGYYRGNPTIHDMGSLIYGNVLQQALPTRNKFSAGSVDTWPRYVQSGSMFGGMLHIPVPDVDRTDYLLVLGANPAVSNGSLMTAPDMKRRMAALRERGGKLVVIDPRRSETADRADEHHFIRPGGDAALVLAMIHTLFDESLVDLGDCQDRVSGLEQVEEAVRSYSPERASEACGIAPETIRRLARELAAAERAACYGRMGTCVQLFGTLSCWGIELLNILTGNLDRPGGVMFTRPAAPLHFAVSQGEDELRFGRHSSRSGEHDEIFGELPLNALAEEIETPGEGQIRSLVTFAGNPASTAPNSERLSKALESLDFMVALDFYINETTRHADLILPPTAPLEHGTYDLALYHFAVRNVAKYSPPSVTPEGESLEIWHIILELAKRLMGLEQLTFEQLDAIVLKQFAERVLADSPWAGEISPDEAVALLDDAPGPERILDLMLRVGPYGDGLGRRDEGITLEKLREHPHGLDLGALEPCLDERIATPSGRIELAPARIVEDLPRLDAWIDQAREPESFLLIGRRDLRSMNSWLHNLPTLAAGKPRCTLQIHPDDARSLGLGEGDAARVASRVGGLIAPVELSDRLMRGVVSLPHGWGQDLPGTRLEVASARPGVNANILTDDLPADAPSGTSVLNGIPVTIAAQGS